MRGINVGAGIGWHKDAWEVIDHKRGLFSRGGSAWRINKPAEIFDAAFSSHVLEHIPHSLADVFLAEMNRVLVHGGIIRLLCPDLRIVATAYVNGDAEAMARIQYEDPTLRTDLGPGGQLMNLMVSAGTDGLHLSRSGDVVGGYAHLYAYDFDMLRIMLERNGFSDVRQCQLNDSILPEMREPLRPIGSDPVWREETEWGDRSKGITGFDRSPFHSLIVEARKSGHPTFTADRFGSNARGLDAAQFPFVQITEAYLRFCWHKAKAYPRTLEKQFVQLRRTLRAMAGRTFRSIKARLVS